MTELVATLQAQGHPKPRRCPEYHEAYTRIHAEKARELAEEHGWFLASQFAAVMAGFFHHDECLTVVQAIGLQALLRGLGTARGQ